MRPARPAAVAALAAIAAAALAAAPAVAETVLAREWAPTKVSSHGRFTAWSSLDRDTGAYRLLAHDGRRTTVLPVAPRRVPFDVDLGPGDGGRTVAVYSRCERDPPIVATRLPGLPTWAAGRGCDLVRLPLEAILRGAASGETPVGGASTDQASEFLPSQSGERIAFGRVYTEREGRRGRLPYLYVREPGSQSRRIPGGARGASGLPGPMALDLYLGRYLGFAWGRRDGGRLVSHMRLARVGGGHTVLDGTADGPGHRWIAGPGFDAGRVAWLRGCALCRLSRGTLVGLDLNPSRDEYAVRASALTGAAPISASPGATRASLVRAAGISVTSAGQPRCRSTRDDQRESEPGCEVVLLDRPARE